MFFGKVDEAQARRIIADAKMRRGLFEWLWQFHPDTEGRYPRPCPSLSDEQIKSELKRILGG